MLGPGSSVSLGWLGRLQFLLACLAGSTSWATLAPSEGRVLQLELLCNGFAIPNDLSLSAIRAFIWKRSGDMRITFRYLDPSNPAPQPVLKPP